MERVVSAVVVGASSTLGQAVVRELAKRGARVGGTFLRGEEAIASLSRDVPGFVARRLDLTIASDIERVIGELATELGAIDVLIHCAAIASAAKTETYDRLADVDPDALARMLAVNVASPLFCARAFAAAPTTTARLSADTSLARTQVRNLILVGSIDGAKGVPTATPYATSKGAVVAMVRALAKELGPAMMVNCVAPGVLDSGITRVVPEDVKREYVKHSAMKRFGTHAEVARTIAWLALENTYVTGQTLILDGGL